jgi:two-component system, OmpR family, response regulator
MKKPKISRSKAVVSRKEVYCVVSSTQKAISKTPKKSTKTINFATSDLNHCHNLDRSIHNCKGLVNFLTALLNFRQNLIFYTHSVMMPTATAKILVVDDDPAIRNLIVRFLSQRSYQVEAASDGKSALELFEQFSPDLAILDVNLPDYIGYNLCEQMQSRTDVFILMLTSRTDAADKREGFLKGADDYLTKPFDLQELEFRVKAILKRQRTVTTSQAQPLNFKELSIDPIRREVKFGDTAIVLTALEFDLLLFLATRPGRVWRREELIQNVWDYEYVGDQRVVDVHIGQIRKKIESFPAAQCFIQTVRGVGYKFEVDSINESENSANKAKTAN